MSCSTGEQVCSSCLASCNTLWGRGDARGEEEVGKKGRMTCARFPTPPSCWPTPAVFSQARGCQELALLVNAGFARDQPCSAAVSQEFFRTCNFLSLTEYLL